MATNKPNKFDVRVRYVKTQAVEMDCPAMKERTALFNGRVGEYTTTHEVFVPGAVARDVGKIFYNPETNKIMAAAMKQAFETVASLVMAGNPTLGGVAVGTATVVQNALQNMVAGRGKVEDILQPGAYRRPPNPDVSAAIPPPLEPVDNFGVGNPPHPPKRARKAKAQ